MVMQASAGTVILMLFWDRQGPLVQNYMCKRATFGSGLVVTSLKIIWEQPPAENIKDCSVLLSFCSGTDCRLHTTHVTAETKTFIFECLPLPPYPLDLTTCGCPMFRPVKEVPDGRGL
jgi:hypothetical protein